MITLVNPVFTWYNLTGIAGLLTKAISDAHVRTCLYTNEQIERMRGQLAPQEQVEAYKNMVSSVSRNDNVDTTC